MDAPPAKLEPGGSSSFTGEREPVRVGMSVEQLLFDQGVSTARVSIADKNQQAVAFETEALRQDLYLLTVTAILNVRFNLDLVQERELAEQLASLRLEEITTRQKVGASTKTDVDQALARKALAMAELADANRSLRNIENDLRRLTGESLGTSIPKVHGVETLLSSSPEKLLRQALSQNPSYLAAQARVDGAAFAIDQAKGIDGPQVLLVAEAGYARHERFGLQLGEAEQLGAFLRGTWRFGTGGAKAARIQRSRSLQQAARLDLESVRRQIDDDIRSVLADIESAEASIEARTLQLEAAKTARKGIGLEVETGRRTELDRLDADRSVASARVALLRSETDLRIAEIRLNRLLGLL